MKQKLPVQIDHSAIIYAYDITLNILFGKQSTHKYNKRTIMVLYRSPEQTDLHTYC